MISETYIKWANEKGKELVDWNKLEKEEKKKVMDNFEEYLIVFG